MTKTITFSLEEINVLIEALQASRDKSYRYDQMEVLLQRLVNMKNSDD